MRTRSEEIVVQNYCHEIKLSTRMHFFKYKYLNYKLAIKGFWGFGFWKLGVFRWLGRWAIQACLLIPSN